ncbi:MAG: N-acetyltransferase [Solimonas sp.]
MRADEAEPPALRPAQRRDARALLPLVYASGPAAFDYVFAHGGRTAGAFLAYALDDGRGLIGWPHHHVAVLDGRVVGCVATYGAHELAALANATLRQYFRFYAPWTALSVLRRALHVGVMQPPPEHGDFYVAHLSVAPAAHRRGIASRLLAHALDAAQALGYRHCALDVASDNGAARALYGKHGFRLIAERALPRRDARVPSSCRLRLALRAEMKIG